MRCAGIVAALGLAGCHLIAPYDPAGFPPDRVVAIDAGARDAPARDVVGPGLDLVRPDIKKPKADAPKPKTDGPFITLDAVGPKTDGSKPKTDGVVPKLDAKVLDTGPGPVCAAKVLFSKSFAAGSPGWVYSESGVKDQGGSAYYPNPALGGSVYYPVPGGLFSVPSGCSLKLSLDRTIDGGTVDIRMYDAYCDCSAPCNNACGSTSYSCSFTAGTGVMYCTFNKTGIAGTKFYTLRLYRNHGQGATAMAHKLTIETF